MKSALLLVPLLFLNACSRPDDSRVQQLEGRVARLEAQVARLQQVRASEPADATPQQATARAAAQYCATLLASSLEEYRQDNARYPAVSGVTLPSACQDFRVAWVRLEAAHYRFQVSGQAGGVLASETR